ncbi:MAG: restriction endonuclease subunit S [Planctomycetota bacterium]|nr:restriction endonuclease subunit S [Planctomycetota bacterium]
MIADLKPYAEYKDSGLEWLGQVPSHWLIRRIKTVLRETDSRSVDGFGSLLSLTRVRGLIPRKDMTDKMHSAKTLVGYKRYRSGQVVMNRMQAWSGMFGAGEIDGLVSPDYAVFDVLGAHAIWLVLERLKTPDLVAQFASESKGIGSGFNRLYSDRFGQIRISLPPLDEQAVIVQFLDWTNRRLERAIRAKRKVIALLTEQKQAIIQRAVTRGLDRSVRSKPSGLPWLGDIPQNWELTALRRYWRVADCKHLTVPFVDEGIALASVTEVQNFSLNLDRCKKTKLEWFRILIDGDRRPKRGDLIYCRNVSVGACALVETDSDFAMGQDVCLIRSQSQNQRFLNYFLRSPFMKHQVEQLLVGSTFKRINISEIKALTVLVPPRSEQDAICDFLDAELLRFDVAIERLGREIALLREYRTRSISDVVTGKLDVREAAAHLPSRSAEVTQESGPDTLDREGHPDETETEEV